MIWKGSTESKSRSASGVQLGLVLCMWCLSARFFISWWFVFLLNSNLYNLFCKNVLCLGSLCCNTEQRMKIKSNGVKLYFNVIVNYLYKSLSSVADIDQCLGSDLFLKKFILLCSKAELNWSKLTKDFCHNIFISSQCCF